MKRRVLLALAAVIAVVAAFIIISGMGHETTDDAAFEAHAIPMFAKVPGYVVALHVRDNQSVKQGDVLLEIDPRDYRIALDQARGTRDAAKAALQKTQLQLKRMQGMNNLARSRKDLEDATADAAAAEAAVETARAAVARAKKDLADCQLIAPSDGVVTNRGVEQGAYVTDKTELFSIVTPERWVVANFKETQLRHMKAGQKVDITVDAYPDVELHGKIDSIQHGTGGRFSLFPPENATGNFVKIVQRVPVKITIDSTLPKNIVLAPGMSVVPTVYTR